MGINKMNLSVIIPAYNCETTISRCVNSITRQLDMNQNEIIIVDDGSIDRTEEICKNIVNKSKNIYYLRQENSGVSAARNRGLEIAEGKYLMFADSDDELAEDSLCAIISCAPKYDLVIAGIKIYSPYSVKFQSFSGFFTPEQIIREYGVKMPEILLNGPCAKIFNMDIVRNNGIRFDESIDLGEDSLFVFEYLQYCRKIIAVKNIVYNYYQCGNESLTAKFRLDGYQNAKAVYWRIMGYCREISSGEIPNNIKVKYKNALLFYIQKAVSNRQFIPRNFIDGLISDYTKDEIVNKCACDNFDKSVKQKILNKLIANRSNKTLKLCLLLFEISIKIRCKGIRK